MSSQLSLAIPAQRIKKKPLRNCYFKSFIKPMKENRCMHYEKCDVEFRYCSTLNS
jgi:hypothetical protein